MSCKNPNSTETRKSERYRNRDRDWEEESDSEQCALMHFDYEYDVLQTMNSCLYFIYIHTLFACSGIKSCLNHFGFSVLRWEMRCEEHTLSGKNICRTNTLAQGMLCWWWWQKHSVCTILRYFALLFLFCCCCYYYYHCARHTIQRNKHTIEIDINSIRIIHRLLVQIA